MTFEWNSVIDFHGYEIPHGRTGLVCEFCGEPIFEEQDVIDIPEIPGTGGGYPRRVYHAECFDCLTNDDFVEMLKGRKYTA